MACLMHLLRHLQRNKTLGTKSVITTMETADGANAAASAAVAHASAVASSTKKQMKLTSFFKGRLQL